MTRSLTDRNRSRTTRRLRFRSRSVAVSVALIALSLAAAYVGVEAVLALLGRAPLLTTPFALVELAQRDAAISIAVAGALTLAGLVCLFAALTPGRFRRRLIEDVRSSIVIDDDVVASGLSRAVATELGVARTQVRSSVGRRGADVRITPTTGFALTGEPARAVGARLTRDTGMKPGLATRAVIERSGVIA